MNLPDEIALSSIRFTFGDENTENDVDSVVDVLLQAVEKSVQVACKTEAQILYEICE